MLYSHIPVLPDEIIEGLQIKEDGFYVDGTVGGAGHSVNMVKRLTNGFLIAVDRDGTAAKLAEERLRPYAGHYTVVRDNFANIPDILAGLNILAVDGILLDLGVSSHQLDTPERGFSYRHDAKLDMRMDDRQLLTAYDVVNGYTEKRLMEIMFSYGEERFAKRIARAIINARQIAPIDTTFQLTDIIKTAIPSKMLAVGGHPAKRVFQAIRIEVNGELDGLDRALREMVAVLKPGGRLCVITFHSLEDRTVKHCFRSLAHPCTCPRDLPVCVCGKKPLIEIITRKPILPGEDECQNNHRAHSAKLRIAERTDESDKR